jgi:SET domain-containing protein
MKIPKTLPSRYFNILPTELKGEGLFARHPIMKYACVGEYIGPRYPSSELKNFKEGENFYTFTTSDKMFIDGSHEYNVFRKMNHSCQPNVTVAELLDSDGVCRVLFYAKKNIRTNEELCIDYLLRTTKNNQKELAKYRCLCQSKYCRGTMLDLSLLPNHIG